MVVAYALIVVERGHLETVTKMLSNVKGVKRVSVVTGIYDVIARIEVETLEELYQVSREIDGIPGIERTNTHVVEKERVIS